MGKPSLQSFIEKWTASGASERANKDAFLIELCEVLEVPRPDATSGNPEQDRYVFEKDAPFAHEGGVTSVKKIDLFKAGAFVLEAKQGSEAGSAKIGTAKRGTPGWNVAMNDAYGQAVGYAKSFDEAVPFVVVCDIGYCFDLYADFSGNWQYRHFPNAQHSRIYLKDLSERPQLVERLRQLFVDPHALDPAKQAAKVTREVASHLAGLAKKLEAAGHAQELVAEFLMRCLFTMFAEDVGLLPDEVFTRALKEHWIPNPASFPGGVESLWRTMNDGGHTFGVAGRILKFNGGLFKNSQALALDEEQLKLLLEAAKCDWSDVEPAIFGTLLERALDPKERHRLGAHFTPRAYVERLVKPTIEEPLREEWDPIRVQVRALIKDAEEAKDKSGRTKKLNEAAKLVRGFHDRLVKLRILDPACGTGNFLYVSMDVLKRLESEVLAQLAVTEGDQDLLHTQGTRISPEQFLGIEIKRWAKEIAELVLWIGYLQWHFRQHGQSIQVPEPVLRDYKNVEWRDAVLAYDERVLVRDEKGKPVTRWDGETMKMSPVTGKEIPDETAQIEVYEYVNPRKAEWPKADFIVGNPPFIGSKRMREALGDGYVEALRSAYSAIPDGTDYVLYWWTQAALRLRHQETQRFGFITTNSIVQSMNRRVTEDVLFAHSDVAVVWAIADHPWVDSTSGAAVRIAMTVGEQSTRPARLLEVVEERETDSHEVAVSLMQRVVTRIHSNLRAGTNVTDVTKLRSNEGVCSVALVRFGEGFVVDVEAASNLEREVVHPLVTGRDLNQSPSNRLVIDLYPWDEQQARSKAPRAFQHVLEHVKPGRDQIRDRGSRQRWWRFGRDKPELRTAISSLARYIATSEVSRHRVFSFLASSVRPDHSVVVVASDDGFVLGVLSSRIHVLWSQVTGSRLGVGNDLRYNRSVCFDPFPFPTCSGEVAGCVKTAGDVLDAHRKHQQAQNPDLTITGMYNVLEKLRSGEPLTAKDKVIHEQGLVSVLKKIHDDLDAAVFDAYGWPHDLSDEEILERLVALNHERAEEEKRGLVRWLRPEFQAKDAGPAQRSLLGLDPEPEPPADDEAKPKKGKRKAKDAPAPATKPTVAPWPKKLPERISAVRGLFQTTAPLSTRAVVDAFKSADTSEVQDVLESLAALGHLVTLQIGKEQSWRIPGPASQIPPSR